MESYVQTARRRAEERREQLNLRHALAWEVARRGAELLREEFGATRVVAFGSLLQPHLFHIRSDVDLAVWGVVGRPYFRAISRLLDLDPAVSVDLVAFEDAPARLQKKIAEEGVPL